MNIDKSFVGIAGILVIAGVMSIALYFRQMGEADTVKMTGFPMQIGAWKGEDIPLDDRTYRILETRNLVMRRYVNAENDEVYLYIVASEKNRKVAHPPEICYTGSGSKITEKNLIKFNAPGMDKTLEVNSFVSIDKGESLVYYWYKAGDTFTADYVSQQVKSAMKQVMGKMSSVAMIRVSTMIVNGNKEKAGRTLQEFSKEILPII